MGIRVWEGRSGVSQMVGFLSYLGFLKERTSWVGVASYLSGCFAGSCVI